MAGHKDTVAIPSGLFQTLGHHRDRRDRQAGVSAVLTASEGGRAASSSLCLVAPVFTGQSLVASSASPPTHQSPHLSSPGRGWRPTGLHPPSVMNLFFAYSKGKDKSPPQGLGHTLPIMGLPRTQTLPIGAQVLEVDRGLMTKQDICVLLAVLEAGL